MIIISKTCSHSTVLTVLLFLRINPALVLTCACMGGLRGSEITDDKMDANERTLFLGNIHFFRSPVVFEGASSNDEAENDPAIINSKKGFEHFCIPTQDRKSVLEIARNVKDWEVIWSFDDDSKSLADFRGMYLTSEDVEKMAEPIQLRRPNRCAIFFPETKVGPIYV